MCMHSRVNFHLCVFLRFADLSFSISSDSLEKSLGAMANLLDPVNWEAFGKAASKFHRDHPTIRIEDLTHEERLTTPGAKEAYAMYTRGLHKEAIETNGCMPCTMHPVWPDHGFVVRSMRGLQCPTISDMHSL